MASQWNSMLSQWYETSNGSLEPNPRNDRYHHGSSYSLPLTDPAIQDLSPLGPILKLNAEAQSSQAD